MSIHLEAGDSKRQDVSLTPLPEAVYPFTYEDLELSDPIVVGYPVTIGCRVKLCNAPIGRSITHPVTLYINGAAMASQDVTLTCEFLCAETRVEFEFTPGSTRTYRIEIDGLTGNFTATTEVFENTELELVKSALEFPDEVRAAYTRTQGDFSGPFLSGSSELREAYFTFDPTGIANLNCIIGLDLGGYSGWNLGATLIAIRANEYQNWLKNIKFIKWGHPGRLGVGIYGLGFPLEDAGPPPLDSQGYPSRASICGRDYDCKFIHREETHGGWEGCNLRSGDYEFSVNGLLDLAPGSWVVLTSFTLSVCNIYTGYDDRKVVLPLDCYNYKLYRIGTIDF